MNQTEQQLKLTIQALRERQDDFDELISRCRGSQFLLAHPRAIAAESCTS